MVICDSLDPFLQGSLYVLFETPKQALKCQKELQNRFFDGRPMKGIFVNLKSLKEIECKRAKEQGSCPGKICLKPSDSPKCHLVHPKRPTKFMKAMLRE